MATPGNLVSSVMASKTKTKKKHFVAQKVKLFRASDPLLSVLMWGVNHSAHHLFVRRWMACLTMGPLELWKSTVFEKNKQILALSVQ